MNNFRIGLIIFAIIIIIGQFFVIKYSNLSWSENAGSYISTISMVLIIVSLIVSNIHDKKSKDKQEK